MDINIIYATLCRCTEKQFWSVIDTEKQSLYYDFACDVVVRASKFLMLKM